MAGALRAPWLVIVLAVCFDVADAVALVLERRIGERRPTTLLALVDGCGRADILGVCGGRRRGRIICLVVPAGVRRRACQMADDVNCPVNVRGDELERTRRCTRGEHGRGEQANEGVANPWTEPTRTSVGATRKRAREDGCRLAPPSAKLPLELSQTVVVMLPESSQPIPHSPQFGFRSLYGEIRLKPYGSTVIARELLGSISTGASSRSSRSRSSARWRATSTAFVSIPRISPIRRAVRSPP